jgi:hypothetical protein
VETANAGVGEEEAHHNEGDSVEQEVVGGRYERIMSSYA